jgi:hypothetical protein
MIVIKKFFIRSSNHDYYQEDDRMASARIISHETWLYLRGIVGIDGWANFG